MSEHLTHGTLDDFPYNHLTQHMAAETLWSPADPSLCKSCSHWANGFMPTSLTCTDRLSLHISWDYTATPSMGEFDLTVCENCGLPRGGFQGKPECKHPHFPVLLLLKTTESRFAHSVYKCAKLIEHLTRIPTTEMTATESGEQQFFCDPFSWNDEIDSIVQYFYHKGAPMDDSGSRTLPVFEYIKDTFDNMSIPSGEQSDAEASDSAEDGAPSQAASVATNMTSNSVSRAHRLLVTKGPNTCRKYRPLANMSLRSEIAFRASCNHLETKNWESQQRCYGPRYPRLTPSSRPPFLGHHLQKQKVLRSQKATSSTSSTG